MKKDQELLKRKAEEMRDEMRVKDEMRSMALAEGFAIPAAEQAARAPQTFYNENVNRPVELMNSMNQARKTAYAANQHSVSIIGSDVGTAHLPGNFAKPSLQE